LPGAVSLHAPAPAPDINRLAEVDANPNPLREEVYPVAIDHLQLTSTGIPRQGCDETQAGAD
jgi:hypothetical protein